MKNFLPYFLFMVSEIFAVITFSIWDRPWLAVALAAVGAIIWLAGPSIVGRFSPNKESQAGPLPGA